MQPSVILIIVVIAVVMLAVVLFAVLGSRATRRRRDATGQSSDAVLLVPLATGDGGSCNSGGGGSCDGGGGSS